MAAQSSRTSPKQENEREAREYMNGIWRRSLARSAHIVEREAKKGIKLRNLREYINGTCREHDRECTARAERVARIAWSKTESCGISVHGSMRRVHVNTGMLKNWHYIGKC
jgi:hypothetical protein